MNNKFENKIIEVCGSCLRACCWHGMFMCDESSSATTVKKTVKELRLMAEEIGTESEDYWSDEHMKEIYGEVAPYGYKKKEKR